MSLCCIVRTAYFSLSIVSRNHSSRFHLSSQLSNKIVTPSFLIPLRVTRIQWLFARAQATCSTLLPCRSHRSVRSLTRSVVSYLEISWASSRVFSATRSRDAESCFSICPQEQKRVPTLLVRAAFNESVNLLKVTQNIAGVAVCAVLDIFVWRNLVP